MPCGSREEYFQSFHHLKLSDPQSGVKMTPGGQDLNNLGKGPIDNDTRQT
jgi:hypothetical protein